MTRKKLDLILSNFQIDNKPANEVLTESQREIFEALITRKYKKLHIQTSTQYGKSLVVALASIWMACVQDILVSVVAPNADKAKIILRYFINHLGDSVLFASQLEVDTKLERLRKEETKERIIFRDGGGIYLISANSANSRKSVESAMGEGSDTVILDEACLITDNSEATIYRMIAGRAGRGTYVKIGNPFYREAPYQHFYKSSIDPAYHKIFVDYKTGIKEGRYDADEIEDAKKKPLFGILYECKFPAPEDVDEKGYTRLFSIEEVQKAMTKKLSENYAGKFRLGCDIGRGGNFNAYVGRDDKFMWLHGKNRSSNLMDNVTNIREAEADLVFVDDVGLGGGVTDRCIEESIYVVPIRSGAQPSDKESFKNLRSELFFKWKDWIKNGGKMEESDEWFLLYEIKWKVDSGGKFMIEPKDDMKARARLQLTSMGSTSPDVLDAGSMTFMEDSKPVVEVIEEEEPKIRSGLLKAVQDNKKKDNGV